ncbi:MAG: hypothetical protein L0215_01690 [Gemmataceae bacterium]|nr:hypothetical protein [Gemmataceae bacterium]
MIIVKVGGSLYDLPRLGGRLRDLIAGLGPRGLLFPGGGPAANAVRAMDRAQRLGEEASHWLAIHALAVNAQFLRALLPELPVLEWPRAGDFPGWAIAEPYSFAVADEEYAEHLPHTWDVTSDSLALRLAQVVGAAELLLLKSISAPERADWRQLSQDRVVDGYFPQLVEQQTSLRVRLVNFREFVAPSPPTPLPPGARGRLGDLPL